MEKYTVLYIDDEQANLVLFDALFKHVYKIILAGSAEEGLEILSTTTVSIIISDERMPGMTGTQLFMKVKDEFPDIPRVLLTTHGNVETLERAINEAHISRFISKPIIKDKVINAIEEAMEPALLKKQNQLLDMELRSTKTLYENSFNQAAIGFAHIDFEGNILRVNNKILDYLGYSRDEVLGKSYQGFIIPENREQILAEQVKVREGVLDVTHYFENYRHKKGHTVYTSVNLTAQHNINNKPIFFVATIMDISLKKKMERDFQTQSELLQSILDYSKNHIFFKDPEGKFILANNLFCKELGKTQLEVIGKTEEELNNNLSTQKYNKTHNEVIKSKKAVEYIVKDNYEGKDRYSLTYKYPLKNNKEKVWAVGAISTNITDIKEAQLEIEKSNELLEQKVENRTIELKNKNEILKYKQVREAFLKKMAIELGNCQTNEQAIESVTKGFLTHPQVLVSQAYHFKNGELANKPIHEFVSKEHPPLGKELYKRLQSNNLVNIQQSIRKGHWQEEYIGESENGQNYFSIALPIIKKEHKYVFFANILSDSLSDKPEFNDFMNQIQNQILQTCERISISDELNKSKSDFKEFADQLPVAVFESDFKGRMNYLNKLGLQWSEFSKDNVEQGLSIFDFMTSDDKEKALLNLQTQAKGESIENREYTLQLKNGGILNILFNSIIIRKNDVPTGIRGIAIDITELKQYQKELEGFNDSMVNREMRIIELKEEVNSICAKFNHAPIYEQVWENMVEE